LECPNADITAIWHGDMLQTAAGERIVPQSEGSKELPLITAPAIGIVTGTTELQWLNAASPIVLQRAGSGE
jgi:hypothetical protein